MHILPPLHIVGGTCYVSCRLPQCSWLGCFSDPWPPGVAGWQTSLAVLMISVGFMVYYVLPFAFLDRAACLGSPNSPVSLSGGQCFCNPITRGESVNL